MPESRSSGQPQRYCTNCGAQIRPDNAFCSSCGASVDGTGEVPGPRHREAVSPEPSGPDTRGRQAKFEGASLGLSDAASAPREGTLGRLAKSAAAWFGGLSVLSKAVLVGTAVLVLVPWRPLAILLLVLLLVLIGNTLIARMAPLVGQGTSTKLIAGVAGAAGLVLLIGLTMILTRGPAHEVVYEKDMSAMMVSMSGYDYVDNNGVAYIKVEVEDPDDIGPVYEDLAARPKADEYDCVVVDFLVQGDRSGGIADGRIIENRPSCSEDVEFFEQNVSSFDYASETDDVFNDNGVKGVKNPEEW